MPVAPTAAPEPEEVVDPVMAPMLAPDMGPGMVPIGTRDFTLAPSPADGDLSALGYYAYPGADYVPTPSDMPTNLVTVTVSLPHFLPPGVNLRTPRSLSRILPRAVVSRTSHMCMGQIVVQDACGRLALECSRRNRLAEHRRAWITRD